MSEVSLSFQGKPLTMMISELSREKKFGKLVPSLPAFLRTLSVYLFIYWLFWVFIAAHRLSLVAETEGYSSLWYTGFSSWWLLLLQSTGSRGTGFSSCGAQAQLLHGMWNLPGPGIKPLPPALAGRFLSTVPPQKSPLRTFLMIGGGINKCDFKNIV